MLVRMTCDSVLNKVHFESIIHFFLYKQPVYKQLAHGWQIAKQLSGLNLIMDQNSAVSRALLGKL